MTKTSNIVPTTMHNDGIERFLVEETDQDSRDVLCKDVVSGLC